MQTRTPELYKVFSRPTAYTKFSRCENYVETVRLAVCGGDQQSVDLGSSPREPERISTNQTDRGRIKRPSPRPAVLRF
jgi:hypothetical protein